MYKYSNLNRLKIKINEESMYKYGQLERVDVLVQVQKQSVDVQVKLIGIKKNEKS